MFRAEISEETLLSISCIKGLSPEILLFEKKGTVSRDFSLRDGILPTHGEICQVLHYEIVPLPVTV